MNRSGVAVRLRSLPHEDAASRPGLPVTAKDNEPPERADILLCLQDL